MMPDDIAEASAALARLTAEAEGIAAGIDESHPGTSLMPAAHHPTLVKKGLARKRAELVKRTAAIEAARKELEAHLQAQLAEVRAAVEPLRKMVARLEEGIWTVNLYLGRDEEIVTLADGDPAPAETPITVRQMVLSMDEECRVAAESGGIDFTGIAAFDEWLLADPAHLEQVLPEPRGVVVLVPRRRGRDYGGDPWVSAQRNEANRHSYWLIRNGGRLYRMDTEFDVGDRLIPARDEFTRFFVGRRYNYKAAAYEEAPVDPGSSEWLKAEAGADARQRHYMRIALIMQGLVDRTTVFRPLPGPGISFLSEASYDAGHVRIITDAELSLGTGREPFRDWQRRLCSQLRPGMRIIGAFNTSEWTNTDEGWDRSRVGHHSRLSPSDASRPSSDQLHTIERRSGDGFVFLYERADRRYGYEHGDHGRWGDWPYKKRASCAIRPDDTAIVPFDLVTVDEMQAYIEARTERHEYEALLPVLKTAIAAKRAEEEQEAPFRLLLAGELAKWSGVDGEEAAAAVDDLVGWWKLGNRWHRPLVADDPETQAKAIKEIVVEHARRLGDTTGPAAEQAAVERIRALDPDVMFIGRKRRGGYVTYAPQEPDSDIFVTRREYNAERSGVSGGEATAWLLARPHKSWRVLWTSPRWERWDLAAGLGQHLTEPEALDLAKLAAQSDTRQPMVATLDTRRSKLKLWYPPKTRYLTPDRLLTGGRSDTHIRGRTVRWSRSTGNRPRFDGLSYGNSYSSHTPWDDGYRQYRILWCDDDIVALAAREATQERDDLAKASRLRDVAHAAEQAIAEQWKARAEQAEYQRFIEDYADPDLWEGHRKTLHIDYPYHRSGVGYMIARLVETGHQLNGLTVAAALDLYRTIDVVDVDIPDDILQFTFTTPAEGEGDEEE